MEATEKNKTPLSVIARSETTWQSLRALAVIFSFLAIISISLYTNITKPRLWVDEGKTVELARNFLKFRTLDMEIAPGQFSEVAPILQSSGYPVSIPLALFFKLFGLGPHQARIFMLIWIVLTLSATLYVADKMFGASEAVLSFLLIASFASFYDSGRTVVGEIPGFFFLLTGLYYWLQKEDYYKVGLLWGLAVVTKPSVFGLIIPAITITLIERNFESIKRLFKIAVAMLPAAFVWFLVVTKGAPMTAMSSVAEFYKNPYSSDISSNVIRNIKSLPFSTTIIYFSGLFALILVARYLIGKEDRLKKFYNFVIIYSVFAFIYYLRSPGWLRYILIIELLILFILPHALSVIIERIKQIPINKKFKAVISAVSILVLIQTVQLFTISDIYYGDEVPNMISYINSNFPDSSIATFQVAEASAFFKTEKRFNQLNLTGIPTLGENPLSSGILPEVIVTKSGEIDQEKEKKILSDEYTLIQKFGYYEIYKLKSPR